MDDKKHFKRCSSCDFVWKDRDSFLNDNAVEIIGYQKNFENLRAGLFLFNHSCETTFSIEVEQFADLYQGPVFKQRAEGSACCPEHCLHGGNLNRCPSQCECSFVREIIQYLKK